MFGAVAETPADARRTPFHPRSPYAVAKVFAHHMTVALPRGLRPASPATASSSTTSRRGAARRSSPARSRAAWPPSWPARQDKLYLGNLDARRDWGYAPEYVEAMWRMLQQAAAGRLRHRHRRDAHRARVRRASPSGSSASTGSATSRSTRATSARPRSTSCAATPARRARVLGWRPTTTFRGARPDHARGGPARGRASTRPSASRPAGDAG